MNANLVRVAELVAAIAPELRADIVAAVDAHEEQVERRWHNQPVPLAIQRRMWRLDELAEALCEAPRTVRSPS